jgi:hypothetical protein
MSLWKWTLALTFSLIWGMPAGATPVLFATVDRVASGPVQAGEVFTVSVRADGLGADELFGFGFRITFETELTASNPVIDALWTGNTATANAAGNVGATANLAGSLSGPSGDGIALASITFTASQAGVYHLAFGPFTGAGDNVLFDGTVLDDGSIPGFFPATLTVPEPSSIALLALAALAARHRRARLGGRGEDRLEQRREVAQHLHGE